MIVSTPKNRPILARALVMMTLVSTVGSTALAEGSRKSADAHRAATPTRAIHVDTATVLCIAERGVQPNSKPVPQKGKRPAGLAVYGVSVLGLGVADGDVLTDVLGQPVRSQVQVVAMVIAARNQNMSSISATLWHGMKPYTVTVDQPYDMPNCSVDDPSCWRAHCAIVNNPRNPTQPAERRSEKH